MFSAPPVKSAKERDQEQRAQDSPTKQQPRLIDSKGQPGLVHQWRDQVAGLLIDGPERLTGEPVERQANKLGRCAIASLQALDEGCHMTGSSFFDQRVMAAKPIEPPRLRIKLNN